jgi:hypothetical protein
LPLPALQQRLIQHYQASLQVDLAPGRYEECSAHGWMAAVLPAASISGSSNGMSHVRQIGMAACMVLGVTNVAVSDNAGLLQHTRSADKQRRHTLLI